MVQLHFRDSSSIVRAHTFALFMMFCITARAQPQAAAPQALALEQVPASDGDNVNADRSVAEEAIPEGENADQSGNDEENAGSADKEAMNAESDSENAGAPADNAGVNDATVNTADGTDADTEGTAVGANEAEGLPTEEAHEGPFRVRKALRAPDWLILNGSQRTRYGALFNQFRPGLDENDQAITLRTLLTLGVSFGQVSIVGELQDSRAYLTDDNSGISTIVVNALEPLQAYVNLHLYDLFVDGAGLDVRVGRQTMDLGGRRLIARNRFRNTIQNYTGITSHWLTSRGTEFFGFGVLPVRVEPENGDLGGLLENRIEIDRESFDLAFWGAFLKQPLGLGVALEAYFFGLNERDGEDFLTRNRQLYTSGLRVIREPKSGKWDADLESVIQFGSRRSSMDVDDTDDHRVLAYFHHASVGYTFGVAWKPRISAEFDNASGDDPATAREERFDSLFGPRRTEFGPTDIYGPLGRENIISAGLRLGTKPHSLLDGYVSWRANWLADARNAFARTGVRDEAGQSGSFAGNQIELRARLWLIPDSLRWEVGGAAFIQGPFMRDAPNSSGNGDPLFAYTDLELSF